MERACGLCRYWSQLRVPAGIRPPALDEAHLRCDEAPAEQAGDPP